jgi:dihydrofolate reductase
MRKVVVSEFVSLDGVMEDPGGAEQFERGGWTIPYWSDELGEFKRAELFAVDALLLGRVTYQGFAAAWPGQTDEAGYADRMNNLPKYVVSTTLDRAEWNNSTIIKENVADEVARLKEQPGQDILIFGSGQLVNTLIRQGLVDQYNLLVYPVVLGSGKRLFADGVTAALRLVETKAFSSGVVELIYQPAAKDGDE